MRAVNVFGADIREGNDFVALFRDNGEIHIFKNTSLGDLVRTLKTFDLHVDIGEPICAEEFYSLFGHRKIIGS